LDLGERPRSVPRSSVPASAPAEEHDPACSDRSNRRDGYAVTMRWRTASGEVELGGRTHLMGVVNVTPDSFSDGGLFLDPEAAVSHGERLAAEGAGILDVSGESTRPGAAPVPLDEELHRVVPVVERLAVGGSARVSIDTTKVAVAETALQAGARIVNDVSAFRFEPEMAGLVASSGATCCLMHMLGEPRTMQA